MRMCLLQDACPGTKVHVYDMKRALRLPLGDYNATKAILEGGHSARALHGVPAFAHDMTCELHVLGPMNTQHCWWRLGHSPGGEL